VKEQKRRATLRERLYVLIDDCDGAIALPGGIGTLAEIALLWAQLQIQPSDHRPLILIGEGWEKTIQMFNDQLGAYIKETDQNRILMAADVSSAVALLKQHLP
jgi:predicted Rossmann-fold nucleotide-binding protein